MVTSMSIFVGCGSFGVNIWGVDHFDVNIFGGFCYLFCQWLHGLVILMSIAIDCGVFDVNICKFW